MKIHGLGGWYDTGYATRLAAVVAMYPAEIKAIIAIIEGNDRLLGIKGLNFPV